MAFGLQTPREYIEGQHAMLHKSVLNALDGEDITVVSVVSINDVEGGQMILADTSYDKRKLAKRLRLCADILDPVTPYFVKTYLDKLADLNGYHDPHWTADELAISLVQMAPALDGVDPKVLEPAVEKWLQRRKG